MNPLVEQMLNTKSRNDLELEILEQTFEEDCKCEARHNYTPYCSGDVTYRLVSCTNDRKTCKSVIDDPVTGTRVRMSVPGIRCYHCNNLASECWTIRPI